MTSIIIFSILALLAVVVIQIGKLSDLRSKIMGEEDIEFQNHDITGKLLLLFMVGFLVFCVVTAYYYKNWMLGYGPHESASIHGKSIDSMFDITLWFTGIVFFVTQILLFWYAFKYRSQKGKKDGDSDTSSSVGQKSVYYVEGDEEDEWATLVKFDTELFKKEKELERIRE